MVFLLQLPECQHPLHAWLVSSKLYLVVKVKLINTVLCDSEGTCTKHQGNWPVNESGHSDVVPILHITGDGIHMQLPNIRPLLASKGTDSIN